VLDRSEWKKKKTEQDEADSLYRDRAKERQTDANPDYNADDVTAANAKHQEALPG